MIKGIASKSLKLLFMHDDKRFINAKDYPKICRILDLLDSAVIATDLNLPGYNLHKLKGNKKDFWSVTVSKNWRITFRFEGNDAYDIRLEDYH